MGCSRLVGKRCCEETGSLALGTAMRSFARHHDCGDVWTRVRFVVEGSDVVVPVWLESAVCDPSGHNEGLPMTAVQVIVLVHLDLSTVVEPGHGYWRWIPCGLL